MARRIVGNGFTIVDRSDEFLRSARNGTERAVAATTVMVQGEAKRLLNLKAGPTTSHPDRLPSAPGEPPAKRTGTLGRSIEHETLERGGEFIGRVGTNEEYGFWLAIGTVKMAARPFLRPALDSKIRNLPRLLRQAVN